MDLRRTGARLLLVVTSLSLLAQPGLAARYIDTSGNWAERYVNSLSDAGVIPPAEDGKFLPADPVTRAVFCSWMVKVLGIDSQPVATEPSFKDVKITDWFYKPVEIMRQNNYISGYADGFRPHQFIPKGEVVTIISRTLGGPAPDPDAVANELSKYKDGDRVPDYARLGIAEASKAGVLVNNPDADVINAATLTSRAEAAALLYQLNEYLTKQSINQAIKDAENPKTPVAAAGGSSSPAGGDGDSFSDDDDDGADGSSGPQSTASGGSSSDGAAGGASIGTADGAAISGKTSSTMLQGGVQVLGVGTQFRCRLSSDLDSTYSKVGDQFEATVVQPVMVNGVEAVPRGSTLVGEVTRVVSAKNFNFGQNGKIDVKFTEVVTADGRRFPIDASIDVKQLQKAAGAPSPVARAAKHAGVGALAGGAVGAAGGAIISAARGRSPSRIARSAVLGGMFGAAGGGAAGLATSAVKKGSEVHVPQGTMLPVKLDAELAMKPAPPAPPPSSAAIAQPAATPPPDYPSYPTPTPTPTVSQPYGYVPAQQPSYAPPQQPSYPPPQQAYPPPQQAYPPPQQTYPPPQQPSYPPPQQSAYPPPQQPSYAPPQQPSYAPPQQPSYAPPQQPSYPPPAQPSSGYPPPSYPAYPPPAQ